MKEGTIMIRYYCSGFDINNAFGHGLGDMFKKELTNTKSMNIPNLILNLPSITEKDEEDIKYGIEVIKTSYINEKVSIEKRTIPEIIRDEIKIDRILDKLKENKVTPVSAEYVIEDLLKESY